MILKPVRIGAARRRVSWFRVTIDCDADIQVNEDDTGIKIVARERAAVIREKSARIAQGGAFRIARALARPPALPDEAPSLPLGRGDNPCLVYVASAACRQRSVETVLQIRYLPHLKAQTLQPLAQRA